MVLKKNQRNLWLFVFLTVFFAAALWASLASRRAALWVREDFFSFFKKEERADRSASLGLSLGQTTGSEGKEAISEKSAFITECFSFIRETAEERFGAKAVLAPGALEIKGNFELEIAVYYKGDKIGQGRAEERILSLALEKAVISAISGQKEKALSIENIDEAWFLVSFLKEGKTLFSFAGQKDKAVEIQNETVVLRGFDKTTIEKSILEGKSFLLSMENEETSGFYKKYDALKDLFEDKAYTVYSASIIYTLLKVYDFDKDGKLLEKADNLAGFLLSMQSKEPETFGAFHYSFLIDKKEKQPRFVVGTTALSIFTLLDLHQRLGKEEYLQAAKLGGDWLVSMQKEKGIMHPYKAYGNGKWSVGDQESLLYNGQSLSALSRLYKATGDKRYFASAEKIAKHFMERVAKEGCFLGDDYRLRNPISSAWVVMALYDFYKIAPSEDYKKTIFSCSDYLIQKQLKDESDLLYYGRWDMAYSSSGNGWLAEVMMEMHHFCESEKGTDCLKYKEALVKVIRWLLQHTYTEENSFMLKNPETAKGGIFWDYDEKYVRTDSVCHGLNAYAGIISELNEGELLSLPEESFDKILEKIRN